MLQAATYITATLVVAVNAMLLYSIAKPSRRIWPPPAQQTWQYYVVWLFTLLSFGGFIVVGILDWNSLAWSSWIRRVFGGIFIAGGNIPSRKRVRLKRHRPCTEFSACPRSLAI